MMELANMISVPMALTAVIRLGVPAAIWAGGANAPLPAAALLPAGHPDPSVLECLLRLLASRGVFSEHTTPSSHARRYALTAVGRTLVRPAPPARPTPTTSSSTTRTRWSSPGRGSTTPFSTRPARSPSRAPTAACPPTRTTARTGRRTR
ncbi:hypothetical protein QYE76_026856 [Lolium multiflorum]|uniref:O-methyltransferase dimerisation domain-containing protein n=1 Tax=Lolium multiflorum TaxID=4521 RepID=A0AAD8RJJ3_LOLMU|nr:hypothetical protein QYE76_026856 [Lolium multiflorum]